MPSKRDKTKNKLNGKHKLEIIHMLGAWYRNDEIIEYLKSEYNIEITSPSINHYKKNYQDEIEKAREAFNKDVLQCLPVANKAHRLRLRQELIEDLRKNLWSEVAVYREGKLVLDEKGEPKVVKVQSNHININKLLDSIREELEPRKTSITDPTGKKDSLENLKEALIKIDKKAEDAVKQAMNIIRQASEN